MRNPRAGTDPYEHYNKYVITVFQNCLIFLGFKYSLLTQYDKYSPKERDK